MKIILMFATIFILPIILMLVIFKKICQCFKFLLNI
jgi:hypothetical protein